MIDLETREIQSFLLALKEKNFSRVAQVLGITQPTVSLQISKLEKKLGGKLFERLPQGLHPTPLALEFEVVAQKIIEALEVFDEDLKAEKSLLKGLIKYAMPESCQWTPHYRHVMSQIKNFPEMSFQIEICPNHTITEKLLASDVDFGFVVGEKSHPELRFEKFSEESYTLASAQKNEIKKFSEALNLNSIRIIAYPGWESFFECWCDAQGLKKNFTSLSTIPTLKIGSLAGAIHALQEGAGLAVIPRHCVLKELESHKLYELNKQKIASHPVYIARRNGRKLPLRVTHVMDLLKNAKTNFG